MAARPRWPSRPRPTPRGIAGKRVVLYVDPIVQRHVPFDRIQDCLRRHRGGARDKIDHLGFTEDVYRSKCSHRGFEWWVVEFPTQRRMFLGPPEFFESHFGRRR